jgi:phenylpyruvate tautomerase PptA (4-oxalocrotonate tautomerase family)
MPLMFVHSPKGALEQDVLAPLAMQLTKDGEDCEMIPFEPMQSSTTWVYFQEYPRNRVFHGGKSEGNNCISVDINVIQGGYSQKTKLQLVTLVTAGVAKYAKLIDGKPPYVYVVIREVAEANWGAGAKLLDLVDLRNPPAGSKPLW